MSCSARLDPPLDLADRREVLVELAPDPTARGRATAALVRSATRSRMLRRYTQAPRSHLRRQAGVDVAEQPLEHEPRVRLRRHRRGRAAPGEAVGVGAGVAGVAVADRARVVAAELERREARVRSRCAARRSGRPRCRSGCRRRRSCAGARRSGTTRRRARDRPGRRRAPRRSDARGPRAPACPSRNGSSGFMIARELERRARRRPASSRAS